MTPIHLLISILFICLPFTGFNQDVSEAKAYIEQGEVLFRQTQTAQALALFTKAGKAIEYSDDLELKVIANTGMGKCYMLLEMLPEAYRILENTYEDVIDKFPDTSFVFLELKKYLSWSYSYRGALDKELKLLFELIESYKACKKDMRGEIADTYNTIASNFQSRGDFQNELIYIEKAVILIDLLYAEGMLNEENRYNRANIFSSYSTSLLINGNYENALLYANKTILFYNKNLPQYRPLAIPYMIKAKYFSEYEEQIDSAIFYIDKALHHLEADFGDGFPGIQSQYWLGYASFKARILNDFGKYTQAGKVLDHICENWQLKKENNVTFNLSVLSVYNELGENSYQLGKIDESINWYEQGLRMIDKTGFRQNKTKLALFDGLRRAFIRAENWDAAIFYQEKALSLFGYDFYTDDFIRSEKLILDHPLIECGKQTASFLSNNSAVLAKHLNLTEDQIMQRAFKYCKKSIELQVRKKLYFFEVGIDDGYRNDHVALYENALSLIVRLQKNNPEQDYSGEAIWIIEMAKSNLLKEAVYSENLYNKLLSQENKNKRNILRASIFEARKNINTTDEKTLEALHLAKSNYLKFKAEIEKKHPILKEQPIPSVLTKSEIHLKLLEQKKDNQLSVNYFQGDKNLYYTATLNGKVKLFQKELSKNFKPDISKVRNLFQAENIINGITDKDYQWFDSISMNWYDLFISDVLKSYPETEKITIIPHRNINFISMDYLSYSIQEKTRYLIEDYPISYHYTQFGLIQNYNYKEKRTPFGGFAAADCYSPLNKDPLFKELTRANGGKIPGSKTEIEKISMLLNGDVFYENSRSEFLSKSANYAILHIAMHAVADNHNPDQSRLFFCAKDSNRESFSLTASDLATMKFNTDMTVLSACNTGVGKMKDGEGVISLMRVFFQTGSNAVISTLWEIPDINTASIMVDFYKELGKNKTKSEALRQAKLNYLTSHQGEDRMPFFWSGIVIYGDDSPLDQTYFKEISFFKSGLFYLGLALVVLFMSGFIIYRLKASKS